MSKAFLERVLGVEKRETVAVAWSFAYFFCVLSSYYMLRPVREAMGVESGTDSIPLLFSSTFVVMLLASPAFGWVASRYPRRSFLPWVYAFFGVNILLFYAGFSIAKSAGHDIVWMGRVFFVWLSVFNLFVVSVFWSFMADIYTKEQGRRLFGVISAGGSAGALVGPLLTSQLVRSAGFREPAARVRAVVVLQHCLHSRVAHLGGTAAIRRSHRDGGDAESARRQRLRRHDPCRVVALPVGDQRDVGDCVVARHRVVHVHEYMVADAIEGVDARTRLFANLDLATGVLSLLFQLLVVKHSVQRLGLGLTLALLPLLSFLGFALIAVHPALLMVAVFQAARRAIGFGFGKPASDMLYSVVTPEEKYKAKNFIDTAVYRGGDLIGTWAVRAIWGLGITGISVLMLPFALLWALIAWWLGREYRRRDHSGRRIEVAKRRCAKCTGIDVSCSRRQRRSGSCRWQP